MGTGRTFNKAPISRPKKKLAARKRREATQKKRLLEMGADPEAVRTMTTKDIRQKLQHPKKTAKAIAAAAK